MTGKIHKTPRSTRRIAMALLLSALVMPQFVHGQDGDPYAEFGNQILREIEQEAGEQERQKFNEIQIPWSDEPRQDSDRWWETTVEFEDGITVNVKPGGKFVRDIIFPADCTCIAFAPDGLLYGGFEDGSIRAIDVSTGKELQKFRLGNAAFACLAVDEKNVYAGAPATKQIYVWDIKKKLVISNKKLPKPWSIESIKLGGGYVAVGGISHLKKGWTGIESPDGLTEEWQELQPVTDPNVYIYSAFGQPIAEFPGELPIGQTAMTFDGRILLSDGKIKRFRPVEQSGETVVRMAIRPQFENLASCYSFSSDGSQVFAASSEEVIALVRSSGRGGGGSRNVNPGVIRVYSSKSGKQMRLRRPVRRTGAVYPSGELFPESSIDSVIVSPDSRLVAVQAQEYRDSNSPRMSGKHISVLNVASVDTGGVVQLPQSEGVADPLASNVSVAFSPDSKSLAAIVNQGNRTVVRIWDVSNLNPSDIRSTQSLTPRTNRQLQSPKPPERQVESETFDIIGIRVGMTYDEVITTLKSNGMRIRNEQRKKSRPAVNSRLPGKPASGGSDFVWRLETEYTSKGRLEVYLREDLNHTGMGVVYKIQNEVEFPSSVRNQRAEFTRQFRRSFPHLGKPLDESLEQRLVWRDEVNNSKLSVELQFRDEIDKDGNYVANPRAITTLEDDFARGLIEAFERSMNRESSRNTDVTTEKQEKMGTRNRTTADRTDSRESEEEVNKKRVLKAVDRDLGFDEPSSPPPVRKNHETAIPAPKAVHLALERFAMAKRDLQARLRSRDFSQVDYESALDNACIQLINDFGRIYKGLSREQANDVSYSYEKAYLRAQMGEYAVLPQYLDQLLENEWKVINTLHEIIQIKN